MFRKILSAAAAASVVIVSLTLSPRTQACPVIEPETLLSLYKNSKEIHLATFSRSIEGAVTTEEDGYKTVPITSYYDISSTLKGETRKMFEVKDVEYRYAAPTGPAEAEVSTEEVPAEEPVAEPEAEEEEFEADSASMKPGSTVLLFLSESEDEEESDESEDADRKSENKTESEPKIDLVNPRDGVRQIDAGDASVYESRIRELNSIFGGSEKARDAQLVEWLVRSMEHPATRWDGARELDGSLAALDRLTAVADYEEKKKANAKLDDENEPWSADSDEETAAFARLLTSAQKDRLSAILMSPEQDDQVVARRDGDAVLLDVVQRWGGPDLAEYLLQKIQTSRAEAYQISTLMDSVAAMLKDDELSETASAYRRLSWEDDNDVYDEDEHEPARTDEKESVEPESVEDPESEPKPKPARKVVEVRAERLSTFLSQARAILARPEVEVAKHTRASAAGRR
jgi:hypothetical protein